MEGNHDQTTLSNQFEPDHSVDVVYLSCFGWRCCRVYVWHHFNPHDCLRIILRLSPHSTFDQTIMDSKMQQKGSGRDKGGWAQ